MRWKRTPAPPVPGRPNMGCNAQSCWAPTKVLTFVIESSLTCCLNKLSGFLIKVIQTNPVKLMGNVLASEAFARLTANSRNLPRIVVRVAFRSASS